MGGIMKILKSNVALVTLVFCMVSGLLYAKGEEPCEKIAPYENKISHVLYSLASGDQQAISFVCKEKPICFYAPQSYDEMAQGLTKSFMLPRTGYVESTMQYFHEDFSDELHELGISMKIDTFHEKNYGLLVTFTLQPESKYDLVKVVDPVKNMVTFNIVNKI